MSFATALACIDGRIQRPIGDFLVQRFGVTHIDTVTRAGIIRHLTASYDPATSSIIADLEASIEIHGSTQLALVAHHDCAGNPVAPEIQHTQIRDGVAHFRRRYPDLDVVGIWVGEGWSPEVVD